VGIAMHAFHGTLIRGFVIPKPPTEPIKLNIITVGKVNQDENTKSENASDKEIFVEKLEEKVEVVS
jgi:hypothetical protein